MFFLIAAREGIENFNKALILKKLSILFALVFITNVSGFEYYLTVCAIFQNEAPYLEEWIDYHRSQGVEHFSLYNNNSTDNYLEVLQKYIDEGCVELIEWPSKILENDITNFTYTVQIGAYNDALKKYKNKAVWCAFIDIDEFIVPVLHDNITKVLKKEYRKCSGVCVNWQCYGTSNVEKCKSTLNELAYKMKWDHPWNTHTKSIVKVEHGNLFIDPHCCSYIPGRYAVDANHNRCDTAITTAVFIDKIRINHYWTRDLSYFNNIKIPRYQKWGHDENSLKELLKHADSMNFEKDEIMKSL